MNTIRSAIENTVSISLFNKGLAGKIFEEVKTSGAKVVMKNNSAECVLLSPNEYLSLLDELNKYKALAEANKRVNPIEKSEHFTFDDVRKNIAVQDEKEESSKVEFE